MIACDNSKFRLKTKPPRGFRIAEPAGWLRDDFEMESGSFRPDQLKLAFQVDQLEARRESTVCWELVGL